MHERKKIVRKTVLSMAIGLILALKVAFETTAVTGAIAAVALGYGTYVLGTAALMFLLLWRDMFGKR